MSSTNIKLFYLAASSKEIDGCITTRFLGVAWNDDISTVKECLDEGVLVDSVNEFGQRALKHSYFKWDLRLWELQTRGS